MTIFILSNLHEVIFHFLIGNKSKQFSSLYGDGNHTFLVGGGGVSNRMFHPPYFSPAPPHLCPGAPVGDHHFEFSTLRVAEFSDISSL